MERGVCVSCIEDEYLREILRTQGSAILCSLCGEQGKGFTPKDFARVLDPILRKHFAPGKIETYGEDEPWQMQDGERLEGYIEEVVGQTTGLEYDIEHALVDGERMRPQGAEGAYYYANSGYVPTPLRPYGYDERWNSVLFELKHRRRFFSSSAAKLFARLFDGIDTLKYGSESVAWELPEGSSLFRARVCASRQAIAEAYRDPFRCVGPPPPTHARAGRMNPEGVVVFYGATDVETCLAEIRPALGSDTAVIQVSTTKPLRMFDFGRLTFSYEKLSYFQPDYTEQAETGEFLQSLQTLISQPIVPGREADYLITQTMTEYLAHIHEKPFDGILFRSVQRDEGTNIVVFPLAENVFPLAYVDGSLRLYSTESISYKHRRRSVDLTNGQPSIQDDPEDE